jgi:hypothetical protein
MGKRNTTATDTMLAKQMPTRCQAANQRHLGGVATVPDATRSIIAECYPARFR